MTMLTRERFAWVWIAALVIVFGAYFTTVTVRPHAELPFLTQIGMLAVAMGTLALVAVTARFLFRRGQDEALLDERDRQIESRSTSAAYNVLMGGMIIVGCVMPFSSGGWDIVHAALLAIAAAEIVHHGLVVSGYRRGFSV